MFFLMLTLMEVLTCLYMYVVIALSVSCGRKISFFYQKLLIRSLPGDFCDWILHTIWCFWCFLMFLMFYVLSDVFGVTLLQYVLSSCNHVALWLKIVFYCQIAIQNVSLHSLVGSFSVEILLPLKLRYTNSGSTKDLINKFLVVPYRLVLGFYRCST